MSPLETSHPQYLHRYPEKPVVNLASTSSAPVIPLTGHVSDLKSSPSMSDVTIKTGSAPSLRSASSNSNSSPTELHFNPNSDNLTFFHDEESDNKDDDVNNDYASSEPKSIDTSISDSTAHTSNTKKQAKKPNRMSHNKIEKKYRTNINTKFLELKNAVPTLRILDNASEINFDELEGLTPAARLNKANILSKATEYIKHLESKNTALTKEIKSIRSSSNYTFQPSTSLNHNVPIEVISDLPNQPRYSHIVNPRDYNNNRASTYSDSNISSVVSPTANEYQLNRHFYNKSTQNSASNSSSNSNIYTNNFSVTTANSNAVYSESAKVENRNNYGYSASMNQHYQGTPYIYQNNYDSQHFQQNPQHHGQMQYQQQVHYQTSQAQPQQTQTTSNQPIQQTFQQNTQQQSSMQNISHAYPYDSSSMSRKIMVGGIAALVGTNLSNNNFESANDMYTLSANPILFIFNKSIHYLQLITLFSCFYFFINPLITSFIASFKVEKQKDENLKTEPFYVTILLSVIHMLSPDLSSTLNIQPNSTFTHLTPLNGTASFNNFSSLSIYPASPFETFMAYINVLKFNDVPKADFCNKAPFSENESIECAFNKIILLNMLSRKNPLISKVTKLDDKIESLSKHLINLSEKDKKYKDRYQYSKILEFIRFDKSFFDSKIIFDQLFEILRSLNHTKSTRETAINLYGKDSTGKGYNSVYEYLYATPLNKLNLFELVSVLWFVENVRLRLIKFLGDMVIDENNEDKEEELEELAIQINKIESLVPTPCMKLIKCCKIFKSLLKPTSEEYLNDALKLILLNIEQNLISMKKNIKNNKKFYIKDELLEIVNSHIPILPKVLEIIKFVQKNPITCDSEESGETMQLISDENRLSLICSIILHQYKIGNHKYGRSLIKYLKREGSQNFMPTNSVSLMALIATFNTLVVILNHEKKISKLTGTEQHQMFTLGETGNIEEDDFEEFDFESQNSDSNVDEERENETEHQVLEQLLFSMRLYVGGDNSSSSNVTTTNLEESIDYDILSLHYGLQSEFSHKLLELAKELVGYSE